MSVTLNVPVTVLGGQQCNQCASLIGSNNLDVLIPINFLIFTGIVAFLITTKIK